jgi:hypothetical protein
MINYLEKMVISLDGGPQLPVRARHPSKIRAKGADLFRPLVG